MIVVTGTVEVAADGLEKALQLARVMVAETRKEPGCRTYGFYQDIEAPGRIRIYEEWVSPEALAAHFETPHMAAFQQGMSAVTVLSMDVKRHEAGEPQPVR